MERFGEKIIAMFAAVFGVIAGWYGGWTAGSKVLVLLMVVDYVTGCACALTGHSTKTESGHFWSHVAFMGLLKKGLIMAVVLVAAQLDKALGSTGDGGAQIVMFRSAAEFFYIATEALSITENAGLMGVNIPKPLRKALEALRDKNDGEDD